MKRGELIEVIEALSGAIDIVQENWPEGDLAGAVRNLIATRDEWAKPALDWWNSDD